MSKFYDLLNQIRGYANASKLEALAGIPKNTLNKHYNWCDGKGKNPCSPEHAPHIVHALCRIYGSITFDGATYFADDNTPNIFEVRPIPGRKVKCFEQKVETASWFEYSEDQYRHLWCPFDFMIHFSNH